MVPNQEPALFVRFKDLALRTRTTNALWLYRPATAEKGGSALRSQTDMFDEVPNLC